LYFYFSWVNFHREKPSFPDEDLTIGRLHTVTLSYSEARRSVASRWHRSSRDTRRILLSLLITVHIYQLTDIPSLPLWHGWLF
jgi:hypothetical protein